MPSIRRLIFDVNSLILQHGGYDICKKVYACYKPRGDLWAVNQYLSPL